jgi:hypothetical protein
MFASLSATSSMVASQDTSRSPAMNAPAMPGAAWTPRSRADSGRQRGESDPAAGLRQP